MSEGPLDTVESTDDQARATSATVKVARAEVEEIQQLLQESYDAHPNRLVRAALKKVQKLTT